MLFKKIDEQALGKQRQLTQEVEGADTVSGKKDDSSKANSAKTETACQKDTQKPLVQT